MSVTVKTSGAPGVSLSYITLGAVLAVLSGTSFLYFASSAGHPVFGYIRACALILGLAFLAIGFGVGRIGHVSGETDQVSAAVVPSAPAAAPVAAPDPQTAAATPIYTATTTRSV